MDYNFKCPPTPPVYASGGNGHSECSDWHWLNGFVSREASWRVKGGSGDGAGAIVLAQGDISGLLGLEEA